MHAMISEFTAHNTQPNVPHMRIIWFATYDNHMNQAWYGNHMFQLSYDKLDYRMISSQK